MSTGQQISMFELMSGCMDVPQPTEEGMIPKELLVPSEWEHWKFQDKNLTLRGGAPYIIDAVLAILPGNRLYSQEWTQYPFMTEFSSETALLKEYAAIRKRIVERANYNNEHRSTVQVTEIPTFEDMWCFEPGKYSEREYAETKMFGYQKLNEEEGENLC